MVTTNATSTIALLSSTQVLEVPTNSTMFVWEATGKIEPTIGCSEYLTIVSAVRVVYCQQVTVSSVPDSTWATTTPSLYISTSTKSPTETFC
jgi:hypothetical protein